MREPAEYADEIERAAALPAGSGERFFGYGVMGLPFASGHILGLRRFPASSIGPGYRSVWHRDPGGRWTFYQDQPAELACTRYFGAEVEEVREGPIEISWTGPRSFELSAGSGELVWTTELASTPVTRALNGVAACFRIVHGARRRARGDVPSRRSGAARGPHALDGCRAQRTAVRRQSTSTSGSPAAATRACTAPISVRWAPSPSRPGWATSQSLSVACSSWAAPASANESQSARGIRASRCGAGGV